MVATQAETIGRYTVLELLGEGGMGTVYAVYDGKLDRRVALKLVKGVASDAARKRMLREAQAMARLSHPNVVPVFEVGEHNGELFIAMEFVQGQSLRQWRAAEPRSYRDVVAAYAQAGDGLAAAHAQGLIHRDFKPDNVVVGEDGRVRVLDFGLAAQTSGPAPTETAGLPRPQVGGLDTPLTETGAVVGTPAYMAPEQILGESVDPRTDQFGLCVALWEGLYGARPFQGATRIELFDAITRGRVTEPGNPNGVPTAIDTLLRRGLAPDPADRWPDLSGMLGELRRRSIDPAGRRRVVLGGAAVLAASGASVWGYDAYGDWQRAQQLVACETAAAQTIAAVWNEAARTSARDGLVGTGVVYAEATADRVLPRVDAYVGAWTDARTEVCTARQIEQRLAHDEAGRAMWCLEQRSMDLAALVQQLRQADDTVAQEAVTAVGELRAVRPCLDAGLLKRLAPSPAEDEVDAFRAVLAELSRVGTLSTLGKYDEGLPIARAALTQAETLGDAGLEAAARVAMGDLLDALGEYEQAEEALEAGYFQAAKVHALDTMASAASVLASLVGSNPARYKDGVRWGRLAAVALDDLGIPSDDPRWAVHRSHVASVHFARGAYDEARPLLREALEIDQRVHGVEHPNAATSLNSLAALEYATGNYAEASALFERALAIQDKALGPDHPHLATTYNNLAGLAHATGDYTQARTLFERALAITERALGSEHPDVAQALHNLATLHKTTGDYAAAQETYTRALRVQEKLLGPDHPKVALTLGGLATASYATGDHAQARALHERALAIHEKTLGPDHTTVALALYNVAGPLKASGEPEGAMALLERALVIFDAHDGTQPGELEARFLYSVVASELGTNLPRAIEQAEAAAKGYESLGPARAAKLASVQRWLKVYRP